MTPQHAGRKHYKYGASGADRWMNCHGSIARSAGVPEQEQSGYALDGTEAHELLEFCLLAGITSAELGYEMAGREWLHRFDTPEERQESVQVMLDLVGDLMAAYAPHVLTFLECQFRFPTTLTDDAGGTSDIALYVPDLDMLFVLDLKHGAGKSVDVEDNKQLKFYAVGVRDELRQKGLCLTGMTAYRLYIVQPRAFHPRGAVRDWICDDATLDAFMGEVDNAIVQCEAPGAAIRPGSWCQWCPARFTCEEKMAAHFNAIMPSYNNVDDVRMRGLPDPQTLDVNHLSRILDAADDLKAFLRQVETQVTNLLRTGTSVPGWKLVYAQARRAFKGDMRETAISLAHIISHPDPNVFMPPSLVGIGEAERIIKQAIYAQLGKGTPAAKKAVEEANIAMADLTTKDTSGNITLAPVTDGRPEVNIANQIPYVPVPALPNQ